LANDARLDARMNEYDPEPKRVVPLDYVGPMPRKREPGMFSLGCLVSIGVLIGTAWVFFVQVPFLNIGGHPTPNAWTPTDAWTGYTIGITIDVLLCVVAFGLRRRSLAMGFLIGLLLFGTLTGLIFGICMGH
jgi:hypothetical protein